MRGKRINNAEDRCQAWAALHRGHEESESLLDPQPRPAGQGQSIAAGNVSGMEGPSRPRVGASGAGASRGGTDFCYPSVPHGAKGWWRCVRQAVCLGLLHM